MSSEDSGATRYLLVWVTWALARRCGSSVGISPSGVDPLCVFVERRWHSVGSPWRVGARRVQRTWEGLEFAWTCAHTWSATAVTRNSGMLSGALS